MAELVEKMDDQRGLRQGGKRGPGGGREGRRELIGFGRALVSFLFTILKIVLTHHL